MRRKEAPTPIHTCSATAPAQGCSGVHGGQPLRREALLPGKFTLIRQLLLFTRAGVNQTPGADPTRVPVPQSAGVWEVADEETDVARRGSDTVSGALSGSTRTQSGDPAQVSGTRLTGHCPVRSPSPHLCILTQAMCTISLAQGLLGGWRAGHKEAPSYTSAPLLVSLESGHNLAPAHYRHRRQLPWFLSPLREIQTPRLTNRLSVTPTMQVQTPLPRD